MHRARHSLMPSSSLPVTGSITPTTRTRVLPYSGALKVSVGPTLARAGAKTYSGGSFLYVPANIEHTMGADVDTICIGTAMGPWKTHHDGEMHHH